MKAITLLLLVSIVVCYGRPDGDVPQATNITMYITSYGFNDNSPPSADIAYPKSDGYPTLHNLATETSGNYDDPITFATDKAELAIGSKVYVAHVRKYFIMEDDCVECDNDWKSKKYHIDMWMGPQSSSPASVLYACEDKVTKDAGIVIINPPSNLPVDTTPMFSGGKCTAVIYNK
jgi:hypothetical protein